MRAGDVRERQRGKIVGIGPISVLIGGRWLLGELGSGEPWEGCVAGIEERTLI